MLNPIRHKAMILAAYLLGCTGGSAGGDAPPPQNADTAPDSVTVIVKNRRIDEITVAYQYQAEGVRRLGRVSAGRDRTFRIPWREAPLQLRVRIPGDPERLTNAVDPRPEDTVELEAHGSFNPRSLRIIYTPGRG